MVIDVEIMDCGDLVIRNIGEELIRENHKNINFYFISEPGLYDKGYTIVSEKNKEGVRNSNKIVLTEEKGEKGIFLYQAKAKIKAEILKIVAYEENCEKLEVVSGISPYNLLQGTLFNHFIACDLAREGFKVCFLSLNIDFPFSSIGWDTGNKGLLKALYYFNNQDNFNQGIISRNVSGNYDYVEVDIKGEEVLDISTNFIVMLIDFLAAQKYRYLIFDYGFQYIQLKDLEDHLFFIKSPDAGLGCGLTLKMENNFADNIKPKGNMEIIEAVQLDRMITFKNGKIKFNYDREESNLWKRSLRKKLLKP